jgi:hypothetical protein
MVWAQAMAACSTTRRNSSDRSDSIWPFFTGLCMVGDPIAALDVLPKPPILTGC